MWWIYALLSALFAALTAIFAKIGVTNVNSNQATAIRTIIILVVAWELFSKGTVYNIRKSNCASTVQTGTSSS